MFYASIFFHTKIDPNLILPVRVGSLSSNPKPKMIYNNLEKKTDSIAYFGASVLIYF